MNQEQNDQKQQSPRENTTLGNSMAELGLFMMQSVPAEAAKPTAETTEAVKELYDNLLQVPHDKIESMVVLVRFAADSVEGQPGFGLCGGIIGPDILVRASSVIIGGQVEAQVQSAAVAAATSAPCNDCEAKCTEQAPETHFDPAEQKPVTEDLQKPAEG